jgi:hypothetical protein
VILTPSASFRWTEYFSGRPKNKRHKGLSSECSTWLFAGSLFFHEIITDGWNHSSWKSAQSFWVKLDVSSWHKSWSLKHRMCSSDLVWEI